MAALMPKTKSSHSWYPIDARAVTPRKDWSIVRRVIKDGYVLVTIGGRLSHQTVRRRSIAKPKFLPIFWASLPPL